MKGSLAPAFEELGWSGYGIDSLRSRFNMLTATILFGVIWSVWHLPLFFIKGYYHYNLLQADIIYAANFFISVILMTVVTNWLYFKNNRSIIVAMVFHAIVVVSCEIFQVLDSTKCIVTVVLIEKKQADIKGFEGFEVETYSLFLYCKYSKNRLAARESDFCSLIAIPIFLKEGTSSSFAII